MPGRGRPWKGVGEGNPDRIGSAAIADGAITEADLDSSVTTKLNSSGHVIEDDGTPVAQQPDLNFTGAGVSVADNAGQNRTDVTITGGGGGLDLPNLVDPNDDFYFYDEFFYPSPSTHFPHFETSVSSINASNNTVGGAIDYNTTASANNVARVNICGAGMQVIDASKRLVMRCRVQLPNASVATNGLMVGFFNSQSNGPGGTFPFSSKQQFGLAFLLDGSGNIETYTDDNSTPETNDTGVAQDNLMHVYEIDFDPAGTPTITWKIDGATVHTQTTNLPSFNGAWYCNAQTSEAVGKSCRLDSLFIYNER